MIRKRTRSSKKVNAGVRGKTRKLELSEIALAAYLRNGTVFKSLRYFYYQTVR